MRHCLHIRRNALACAATARPLLFCGAQVTDKARALMTQLSTAVYINHQLIKFEQCNKARIEVVMSKNLKKTASGFVDGDLHVAKIVRDSVGFQHGGIYD